MLASLGYMAVTPARFFQSSSELGNTVRKAQQILRYTPRYRTPWERCLIASLLVQ